MVVLIFAIEGDMYVRGKKFEEVMYARKYFTLKLITSEIFLSNIFQIILYWLRYGIVIRTDSIAYVDYFVNFANYILYVAATLYTCSKFLIYK